jgi:hypothetical protein
VPGYRDLGRFRTPTPSRGDVLPRNQTEVGSDFENVHAGHLLGRDAVPPWERLGEPVTYVASGRQGLALVARELHRLGRRRVVVPGYLCDSMVCPSRPRAGRSCPLRSTPASG